MNQELTQPLWDALRGVRFPGMSRDIVSFGFVKTVRLVEGRAEVDIQLTTGNPEAAAQIRADAERACLAVPGVESAAVEVRVQAPPAGQPGSQPTAQNPDLIPEVRAVVAVASGKGGVGKSTVTANLAVSLAKLGHRVGVLDADIYGPSMPMMFGIHERPMVVGDRILPFERHGVKVMSLGVILETDTPVIWRGPMVMKAIEQLLGDVEWGALDYLVVDLPPGTGDAQLTVTQKIPLAAAVIVTTPQDVALIDARKGLAMFRKVSVPVAGIIENMATFVCPHCGKETDVFKRGGGERTAELLGCPFLGSIPLDPAIVVGGDAGVPIVVSQPESAHAAAFRRVAEAVAAEVEKQLAQRPRMTIV
ncbi:MAG: Mrp/NBP35 family ATP-binding protein [Acidobacteria bacterium]|nr:Mrp/NBP35 family ATP-binding protein [Acidobacteriota bacterium]